jgi:uncharacterized protein (DUF4415 family)
MTISDEPDEDADSLDDENLLETCVGVEAPKRQSASTAAASGMPDWPPSRRAPNVRAEIDVETLAWFKTTRPNWRDELGSILKAWVAAQKQTQADLPIPPAGPET